jgi:hypothetical protein
VDEESAASPLVVDGGSDHLPVELEQITMILRVVPDFDVGAHRSDVGRPTVKAGA